jgi:hypothetical protein
MVRRVLATHKERKTVNVPSPRVGPEFWEGGKE